MSGKYLITGGARSGKSTYAEKLCLSLCRNAEKRLYIATAQAFDDEMRERIEKHRKSRGNSFVTFEEPLYLGKVLREKSRYYDIILVECLTVWTGNLLYKLNEDDIQVQIQDFISAFCEAGCDVVLVTNETGCGIVPDNEMSRKFRDIAGIVNRKAAEAATDVVITVCGIPVQIKGSSKYENE